MNENGSLPPYKNRMMYENTWSMVRLSPPYFGARKKGAPSLERPQNTKLIFDFSVNTATYERTRVKNKEEIYPMEDHG